VARPASRQSSALVSAFVFVTLVFCFRYFLRVPRPSARRDRPLKGFAPSYFPPFLFPLFSFFVFLCLLLWKARDVGFLGIAFLSGVARVEARLSDPFCPRSPAFHNTNEYYFMSLFLPFSPHSFRTPRNARWVSHAFSDLNFRLSSLCILLLILFFFSGIFGPACFSSLPRHLHISFPPISVILSLPWMSTEEDVLMKFSPPSTSPFF